LPEAVPLQFGRLRDAAWIRAGHSLPDLRDLPDLRPVRSASHQRGECAVGSDFARSPCASTGQVQSSPV